MANSLSKLGLLAATQDMEKLPMECILKCRSIRIGTYRIPVSDEVRPLMPLKVQQSSNGMLLYKVPHCETDETRNVWIPASAIVSIEACYKRNCLFVQTTPTHESWIRYNLGMGKDAASEDFYCPLNGEGPHQKFITLTLSRRFSESEKAVLRNIYENVLTEINCESVSAELMDGDNCADNPPASSIPLDLSSPRKNHLKEENENSKYFPKTPSTPTRAKKQPSVKQVQVKNMMSSAFIDNLLKPSLIDFAIIYDDNGQARIKFTHTN